MAKHTFLSAIKALIYSSDSILDRRHNYDSVYTILKECKPSQEIVDEVVNCLLVVYKKHSNSFLSNGEALSTANAVLELGASKKVGEKVVKEMVKKGWFRSEETILNFIQREPTRKEIFTMVKSYTDNKASGGGHTEERLVDLAKKYLSWKDVRKVETEIEKFRKDFYSHID